MIILILSGFILLLVLLFLAGTVNMAELNKREEEDLTRDRDDESYAAKSYSDEIDS